ncbi:hypothetical protein BJ741DRAFT_120479 [Chytriomyces cf. hyalinus JEL632]|nr:hypothetical protein BJ741DRAFT_120479 [Chytriomyces cf. hyalinus JEL632]
MWNSSDSIILFNCLKWSSFLLQATVPRQQNIERSKKSPAKHLKLTWLFLPRSWQRMQQSLMLSSDPFLCTHTSMVAKIDSSCSPLNCTQVHAHWETRIHAEFGSLHDPQQRKTGGWIRFNCYSLCARAGRSCGVLGVQEVGSCPCRLIEGQVILQSSFDLFFKQFLTAEMLQNQLCASAERLML